MSAIHRAARNGNLTELRRLLDEGADANERLATGGETPLMRAVQAGAIACARLLVDRGADVNAVDSRGKWVLEYASTIECLRLLLEHGAQPDGPRFGGMTLAALFASVGSGSFARLLLEFGADPDARSRDGRTVAELLADPPKWPIVPKESCDRTLREWSDDLRTSPEEYVARHRAIWVWSLHTCECEDPRLKEWAQRVFDLLGSPDSLSECYERYLSGEELDQARRSVARVKRRQERDAIRRRGS